MRNLDLKYALSLLFVAMSLGVVFGIEPPTEAARGAKKEVIKSSKQLDSTQKDSLQLDSLGIDSLARDTTKRKKSGLDEILDGANKDSLYYDARNNKVFIYNKGSVNYQSKTLNADYMEVNLDNNQIYAYGMKQSVDGKDVDSKPEFVDGGSSYSMDTITYNLKSEKAKIKGVATQEGDGWLVGGHVKKMPDNSINIMGGKYTTCDQLDCPHFYLAMTKAKVIPGKKVITGPAYFVMEDVPFYFLGIPEGFFPINDGPRSGMLMPSYGEDGMKGFYIRDLGYYFTFNDYVDLAVTGGIYTLGSWEASAASRYVKRYKYSGNVNIDYSNVKFGDKEDVDYTVQNDFRIQWTHAQDAKANPGSTFAASVNYYTSGYSKYSATTLSDMLQTQTNSSISYSKSWSGTPFSMSTNMAISQNSQDETISMTFPSAVFNMSRIYPLKRKSALGEQRWWEKISMSYTGKLTNSVSTTESEFLKSGMIDEMKHGINHSIPVSMSFNLFNYLNVTPSVNYNENWYFKSVEQQWNPTTNELEELDPEYGFYRLYNYNTSLSSSTTLYGMYQNKNPKSKVQAIRHTLTPSFGFSFSPDFSSQKHGYTKTVQTDSLGGFKTYSPFSDNAYGVPTSGKSLSMNFRLSQNLEMKVLSDRDTTGVRKVKLIDDLSIGTISYNFMADSMRLSTIPVSIRTTLMNNFGLNLSLTLDPYRVTPQGKRYDKLFFPGRVTSTGWSFGYTFKSRADKSVAAVNDITSIPPEYTNPFYDPRGELDPTLRRQYMSQAYYDFSLPWNFGFNYVVNYSISYVDNGGSGYEPNITQSVGFNGSLTLTPKMGVTFSGGYDIDANELTTSAVSITRDLHCWQMSFSWVPFGYYRSWNFNIGIKASSLADIKYEKSQSMYDNMY